MPTSTAMGTVMVKAVGSVRKNISAIPGSGALLRTTSSSTCARSRRKITNVKSSKPRAAWLITSRNI